MTDKNGGEMKTRDKILGISLIILGIIGAAFVCTFDIIMRKPVNDITGPKSISGLILAGIFIILGIKQVLKKKS